MGGMVTDWAEAHDDARRRFVAAMAAGDLLEMGLALSDQKQAVADGDAERFVADMKAWGDDV